MADNFLRGTNPKEFALDLLSLATVIGVPIAIIKAIKKRKNR